MPKYVFERPLNGSLTDIDIEELIGSSAIMEMGKEQPNTEKAPSNFAIRYGKSPYPRSLCGLATKVLTRSDGKVKHLVSMRDWKWDCPKCAPLLKRYWLEKLWGLSFRFIFRLPTMTKPTTFLRRIGKPNYVHIVANGASWLFLADGDAEKVRAEARQSGYELVAEDISGASSSKDIKECLEQALCLEREPLNTRRKISHSRGLLKKLSGNNKDNESKQKDGYAKEDGNMTAGIGRESLTWDTEVIMKPIEEMAKELEEQGWQILWQSEVEAIAIRGRASEIRNMDIVEFLDTLGVRLKRVGTEYMGLCPFHDDHTPSLSVNREKGLWHCFGCGQSGGVRKFVEEWRSGEHQDGGLNDRKDTIR